MNLTLDRIVIIEKEVTTKNTVGTPVETYALLKTTFAAVKYTNGETEFNEGAQAYTDIDFTIRYDKAVDYKCRIKYEGIYYKILAIEAIGRRDGMRLKCVKFEL